jgi:hypothetical protein
MARIRRDSILALARSGVRWRRPRFRETARSMRVMATRVERSSGGADPRRRHVAPEQARVAWRSTRVRLLVAAAAMPIAAGDGVRFDDGEFHGRYGAGMTVFESRSVTAPALDFRAAHRATGPTNA